ncbi:MAG: 16S rRNA (guanine(966)-N(2))-methyltransferase RsmD [Actinomycetes bacterium]
MTRIIAGRYRGRSLRTPTGRVTRPTSDRTREALFASLLAAADPAGAFLDLYAGSGAVGLEALSRGWAPVVLVDQDRRAITAIRTNVAVLSAPAGDVVVVSAPVSRALDGPAPAPVDVAFADPPYDLPAERLQRDLAMLLERGWLLPDARVVVERSARDSWHWPDGFEEDATRRYGETLLCYGRAAREEST